MSSIDMVLSCTESRRSTLLTARRILDDEDALIAVVGKNALLDCTLFLLARDDKELLDRLDGYMSTDDLLKDVEHINNDSKLRRRLESFKEGLHEGI